MLRTENLSRLYKLLQTEHEYAGGTKVTKSGSDYGAWWIPDDTKARSEKHLLGLGCC